MDSQNFKNNFSTPSLLAFRMHKTQQSVLLFLRTQVGNLRVVHPHHIHTPPRIPRDQDGTVPRKSHTSPRNRLRLVLHARIVHNQRIVRFPGQVPEFHPAICHTTCERGRIRRRPDDVFHTVGQIRGLEGGDERLQVDGGATFFRFVGFFVDFSFFCGIEKFFYGEKNFFTEGKFFLWVVLNESNLIVLPHHHLRPQLRLRRLIPTWGRTSRSWCSTTLLTNRRNT